jgi:hypothetical protein
MTPDALLWHRLGAKTLALIDEPIVNVEIRDAGVAQITVDEETIQALRKLGLAVIVDDDDVKAPSADEILDGIEKRIEKRLAEATVMRGTETAVTAPAITDTSAIVFVPGMARRIFAARDAARRCPRDDRLLARRGP